MEESNMEYFSESYFLDKRNRIPLYEQYIYKEKSQRAPINEQFDIFLSYNISNLNVVEGIYYTLSQMGLKVYLDYIVDADMKRNETNKDSAKRLQNRLKNSKSLIYAQSPEAGKSNWMPWELGIVDGRTGKCIIMPVTKDAKHVSPQREYLLLYPFIMSYGIEREMKVFTETYPNAGEDIISYIRN